MRSAPNPDLGLAVLQRQTLKDGRPHREYREALRVDFWYSCAYCTMTELEASGIAFEIDHYNATTKCPDEERVYYNLLWSCDGCNRIKSNQWPCAKAKAQGKELYRPDLHDFDHHFKLEGVRVEPISTSGEYSVFILGLNRKALRDLRGIRERQGLAIRQILGGLRTLRNCRIDLYPPSLRNRALAELGATREQAVTIQETLTGFLKRLCKSHNIDPDPEAAKLAAARRAYLKSLDAATPEAFGKTWMVPALRRKELRRRRPVKHRLPW